MKKNVKKLLAMLFALVLAVSFLSACSRDSGLPDNTKFVEPDFSTETKLTLGWIVPTQTTLSVTETAAMKYVQEKFNIGFGGSSEQSKMYELLPADHDQKVDLLLATNSLPDIITRMDYNLVNESGESGKLVNLKDYLDYMPNVKALIEKALTENPNNANYLYDIEGNIYRIPNYCANPYPNFSYSYNPAIFEESFADSETSSIRGGLTADVESWGDTWEHVKTALKVVKTHMEKKTGKKYYPLSYRNCDDLGLLLSSVIMAYTDGYCNGQEFIGYDAEKDSFRFMADDPGYKEAIDFVKSLYKEELLNPTYNTRTADDVINGMRDETVAMTADFVGGWTGNLSESDRVGAFLPMDFPSKDASDPIWCYQIAQFHPTAGTSLNAKLLADPLKLGRALQMLDYMYSEEFINLQWYHPDVTNGQYKDGAATGDISDYEYTLKDGERTYKAEVYATATRGSILETYFNWTLQANFYDNNDPITDPSTAQGAAFYEFRDRMIDPANADNYVFVPVPSFDADQSTVVTSMKASVNDVFKTYMANYIATDNVEWNSFVNTMKSTGGTILAETYIEAYKNNKIDLS